MTGAITVDPVTTRADLDVFIRLPGRLAAGDPAWVEPLLLERRRFLSPAHNPFFAHAECHHLLAREGGRPVGRISATLDRLAPAEGAARPGFFGMLDAGRAEVLAPLFEAAGVWLRARGARVMRGPFSLSINQTSGLLVEGFETPPSVMMDHHAPWLGPAVERAGLRPVKDLLAYTLDLAGGLPDRQRRLAERAWPGLTIRALDTRRYAHEIRTVATIFNDAWAGNWGFIPLTEAEIDAMARDLRPILDPQLVRIAELDGRPAAFIVMLPNINEAIAGLRGRLLPFGWARLLWRLRVSGVRSARVPLMGVRREISETLDGKTLPLRLIHALEGRCAARGIRTVELSWLLEDNRPVRALAELLGGRRTKTYRIYETAL